MQSARPAADVRVVLPRAAAALAVGMGVGRFVYTPILPLMTAHAGLSPDAATSLATANYAGYLLGALAGIVLPRLVRSRLVFRAALVVLTATLALMPATTSVPVWGLLRVIAGAASALLFMIAAAVITGTLTTTGRGSGAGWGFGGVGAGIAGSGALVLGVGHLGDWRWAWFAAAAGSVLLAAGAWRLPVGPPVGLPERSPGAPAGPPPGGARAAFVLLLVSYTLEGVGYIVAGTFLVAAIDQNSPSWLGSSAWIVVGVVAVPSAVLWGRAARRTGQLASMTAALVVQAVGIALAAAGHGVAAAVVSAGLFGGTFIGVSALAIASGARLRGPHAVAVLTAGYSAGQLAGPLVTRPLVHSGYTTALVLAAVVVAAAALTGTGAAVMFRRSKTLAGFPAR